jgi:hypothetical protein
MIKYWHRLDSCPGDSLLKRYFTDNITLSEKGKDCWYSCVKRFCTMCGLDISEYQPPNVSLLIEKLREMYHQYWRDVVSPSGQVSSKLELYGSFKTTIGFENYLTLVKNIHVRKALTKIRISAHPLAIESERYCRPIIPRDQRFCKICCKQLVESEKHFLLQCEKYAELRADLFSVIHTHCPNFNTLMDSDKTDVFTNS